MDENFNSTEEATFTATEETTSACALWHAGYTKDASEVAIPANEASAT